MEVLAEAVVESLADSSAVTKFGLNSYFILTASPSRILKLYPMLGIAKEISETGGPV
jgi:hypothetical protein